MEENFEQAIADLTNTRAGWVTRRDAAESLGRGAARAVATLVGHIDDEDRDVKDEVRRALGEARSGLEGIAPAAATHGYTLEELVRYVEKPGHRDVEASAEGFMITVVLQDDRRQRVHIREGASQTGRPTIHVSTRCGEAKDEALRWALRANTDLTHCCMALVTEGDREYIEMVNAYWAQFVTPKEFKACVKELAFYADWAEQKFSEDDTY